MRYSGRTLNLAMSGGGVKGIAYIGMFDEAERRGYKWRNIAGVSAGALAGAFAGAGYNSQEMLKQMESFDFDGIQLENAARRLPVVAAYMEFSRNLGSRDENSIETFLSARISSEWDTGAYYGSEAMDYRSNLLKNLVIYSKYGSLFDGDYLEEWVYKSLARKGIRTFADLRGGKVDRVNPRGYKVRMTGVDCNRAKLVVLPDDMAFYGIDPDTFEVAKAVRISTCVPFAFKPVVISKVENGRKKNFNLVDGGVFDRFPFWLIDDTGGDIVGFKLSGGEKKKFFSVDTALNIIKSLISAVQDIGIPEHVSKKKLLHVGEINATDVYYLDFDLNNEKLNYLLNAGRQAAVQLFDKFEKTRMPIRKNMFGMIFPVLRKRN